MLLRNQSRTFGIMRTSLRPIIFFALCWSALCLVFDEWEKLPFPLPPAPADIEVGFCWMQSFRQWGGYQIAVAEAIKDSWEKYTRLKFRNTGCDGTETVKVRFCTWGTTGCRAEYLNASRIITIPDYVGQYRTERDLWGAVIADTKHEFGHAIGFAHEGERPTAPEECKWITKHNGGWTGGDLSVLTEDYDPLSIMNYCDFRPGVQKDLSILDIQGARVKYGTRGKRHPERTNSTLFAMSVALLVKGIRVNGNRQNNARDDPMSCKPRTAPCQADEECCPGHICVYQIIGPICWEKPPTFAETCGFVNRAMGERGSYSHHHHNLHRQQDLILSDRVENCSLALYGEHDFDRTCQLVWENIVSQPGIMNGRFILYFTDGQSCSTFFHT